MAATTIEIEKTIMAAAGTATVTLSASPWSSIAGTLVEDAETTTGPAVALAVVVEVITAAATLVANTVVAAVAEVTIVAAAVVVAIIVAAGAVVTTVAAEAVATTAEVVSAVTTAAAEALEVTSVIAVVAEISVALVVVATSAEVEETSKEAVVTSMGVAVTSEAAEETSGVAVVAASAVALEASSATMTTSTLVTEEADRPILSKDRKDTTIKITKADHSRITATDPLGITTTVKTTTAGSHEAECVVEAEEAHVATLAGHPETEAVCMATGLPAAARTMMTTIANLQKLSKAVACAVEVTCV